MLQSVPALSADDRVQDILAAYFALSRVINPTRLYGTPSQIFGHHAADMWSPADVEAVFNLNGILAHGLESLLHLKTIDEAKLNEQLRWLVQRLACVDLPATVYTHPDWQRFCYTVDDRLMGYPMPPNPCRKAVPLPALRITTTATTPDAPADQEPPARSPRQLLATAARTAVSGALWLASALYGYAASWAKWFAAGLAVSIFYMAWWSTSPAEWSALIAKWNAIGPAAQLDLVRRLLHAPFPVAATFAFVMATAGALLKAFTSLHTTVARQPTADRHEVQP